MKNSSRFFENTDCAYYPCHKTQTPLNCLFCFCPFYLWEKCPGHPTFKKKEERMIKDCTECVFPHKPDNYDKIIELLAKRHS